MNAPDPPPRVVRRFRYFKSGGADVFADELRSLEANGRAALVAAMKRYERDEHFSRDIAMIKGAKVTTQAGQTYQLWEVRAFVGKNCFRVLFAHLGNHSEICLGVSAIYKNQNLLPKADRDRALKRLKKWVT